MAKQVEAPAGPGPGESTVPPVGIGVILTIMIATAVYVMWTLGTLLDRIPNWDLRNDTLAVAGQTDSSRAPALTPPGVSASAGDTTRPLPAVSAAESLRQRQARADTNTRTRRQPDPLDSVLLRIVLLAGALGGLLHGIRSFVWYVGNRELRWSWVPTYLTLPIVGALLATVMYLLVRAGFVGFVGPTSPSPYGFAAASALVGLFSQPAILKLKEVAETLFKRPEEGADSRPQDSGETPKDGEPLKDSPTGLAPVPVVSAGTVTRENGRRVIQVDGSGFRASSTLTVDQKPVPVTSVTAKRISAVLPDDVGQGASANVTVTTPPPGGGSASRQIGVAAAAAPRGENG